jgi:RNA polymerase sigma factor (sigma-70 family)
MDDHELLQEYIERRSESAFAELVSRHVNLVYSTAARVVRDGPLAQDVAQTVFIALARNPRAIRDARALAGWLYRSAQLAAAQTVRTEQRRHLREHEAMNRAELENEAPARWDQVGPLLEEAMKQLNRTDQDAVVLRYFEGKSLRDTGEALALSEDAAQKRVTRALEKLRRYFAQRGVTATAALLAGVITENSVQAAPAGLAANLANAALAGVGSVGVAGMAGKIFAMNTKAKIIAGAAVVIAVLAGSAVWQHKKIAELSEELAAAQSENDAALRKKLATEEANGPVPTLAQVLNEGGSDSLKAARDALRFVENLKPGDIRGALEALNKRPARDLDGSGMIRNLLLARWVEADANAALKWVETRDADYRAGDLVLLFESWGMQDPEAAMAGLKQINDEWGKVNAAGWMLGTIAAQDPQEAMSLLEEMPANEQHVGLKYRMFLRWAGADPAGALAAATSMPAGPGRVAALSGVGRMWAMQDPVAALAWADTLTDSMVKANTAMNAVDQLSNQDPVAAARYVETLAPGDQQNYMIGSVAKNWAQTDPQAALAWLGNVSTGQVYDQAVQGVVEQVAQTDPAAAAAIVAQMPDPTTRYAATVQLADQWAQNDFTGAMAWVQSLPASDGATRSDALQKVMKNWDDSDPAGAAAYLTENFANDPNFNALADELVGHWASGDPQSALAWAETLPPGPSYDNAMTLALTDLAKTDPQSAWETAMHVTDTAGEAQAMLGVVQSWSAENPAQAAAVFSQIPAGSQQVQAATTLATAWVATDPAAASQWISTLPAGDARDAAVTKLIAAEGANQPATAFNWAKSIGNPDMELTQLNNVVNVWAKQNPAAAAGAVQAAGLTDAQKATLLQTVQKVAPAK